MKYSEDSGHPISLLQAEFEAQGVDITRMLDSTGRLQAAIESENSDQGKHMSLIVSLAWLDR